MRINKISCMLFIITILSGMQISSTSIEMAGKGIEKNKNIYIPGWQQGTPPELISILGLWELEIDSMHVSKNKNKPSIKETITVQFGEGLIHKIVYRRGLEYYSCNSNGGSEYVTSDTPFWWEILPNDIDWRYDE